MLVHELKLTHFRGLLNTEIKFQPGFNLIVGVNGAGKSSVLDALRVLLSQVLPMFTPASRFNLGFESDDIMLDRASMHAELTFSCHGSAPYVYVVDKHREQQVSNADGGLREQTTETPDKHQLLSTELSNRAFTSNPREYKKRPSQPLVLYFSVDRSRATDEISKIGKATNPGYFGALVQNRGLRVQDLVQWWRVKAQIAQEAPEGTSAKQLLAVRNALERLLPTFSNWRLDASDLWVTKKVVFEVPDPESLNGNMRQVEETRELRMQQLSDGERSMTAFVFDLTRRLAQLNENESDPAAHGSGVVLIDEIDLHLHPAWQRRIAIDLPRVFPCLQFIATTHSPQIIGETEPGHAIVLREGGQVQILDESLGRDSGWILRHVMDTPERNVDLQLGLDEIDALVESEDFPLARLRLSALRTRFGDDKELVAAAAAIDRWESLGNEEDQ
jgi:hypothetical protein